MEEESKKVPWTEFVDRFFHDKTYYRIYIPRCSYLGETERKYDWAVLNRHSMVSMAKEVKRSILRSTKVMPDGSWNNDAVNLIIANAILDKTYRLLYNQVYGDNIYKELEKALLRSRDLLVDKKLKYFKEKQEIMENYIDSYVPDDNPCMGYFSLVH